MGDDGFGSGGVFGFGGLLGLGDGSGFGFAGVVVGSITVVGSAVLGMFVFVFVFVLLVVLVVVVLVAGVVVLVDGYGGNFCKGAGLRAWMRRQIR